MGSMNDTYQALIDVWDRTDTDDAQGLHAIGEALVGALQGAAADLGEWEAFREQYTRALEEADALRAENADLKEDEQEALAERNAALDQRNALARQHDDLWARAENAEALERLAAMKMEAAEAERDALRAQLGGMTTEWSAPDTGSLDPDPFPYGYGAEGEAIARRTAAILNGPVYQRLVGPWVEVE